MVSSLRGSIDLIADPANLDASVDETFALMLGCGCRRVPEAKLDGEASLIAVVGFGGILSGACVVRCSTQAAMKMAACMTGTEFTAVDATVQDAIGEVCNIVAGSWKSKIPELASNCGLSVPAVIAGTEYRLRIHPPEFKLHHIYSFDGTNFEVMIVCEGFQ